MCGGFTLFWTPGAAQRVSGTAREKSERTLYQVSQLAQQKNVLSENLAHLAQKKEQHEA